MSRISASATREIAASAGTIYQLLADYRDGHPRILPKKYFPSVEVERGGTGAGTLLKVTMATMGSTRTMRMEVSEPEPGRVLAERDVDGGAVTTFTVEPLGDSRSAVTIATELSGNMLEKLMVPPMLRKIYAEELALLAAAVGKG